MRKAWRVGVALGLLLLASLAQAVPPEVPAALEDWRAWVLEGHAASECPVRDGESPGPECRWPGRLVIEVDAQGARFSQTWTLDMPQRVPLPGNREARPVDVQVDGRAAPVVLVGERPMLALEAGHWRVDGRFAWPRRPATLAVPDEVALLSLRIDGAEARVERNEEGALVLGPVGADEGDELQTEVYRLLADGSPQLLFTRVYLSVAGSPRELVFPPLLPDGFVPVALESGIPARIESDGRIRTQLRSGSWELTLVARALTPREEFSRPATQEVWPAEEIWQFRADPLFRVAQLDGLPGIDPSQVSLPEWQDGLEDVAAGWKELLRDTDGLPAFLFAGEGAARLDVSLRGLPAHRPPRLTLARELWLDFDGGNFSATDTIEGDVEGTARLDLREPWRMQRAEHDGKGLLITRGPAAGTAGVELRDSPLALEVDARVERAGIARASGWTQAFDSASIVLNLPPGYRLLAARGADHAGGSWWEAWSLADLFLLALTTLLAWRLGGVLLVALALSWGVLGWHEPDVPRWSVFLLLLFALAARHVVAGWPGRIVRAARGAALLATVLFGLVFAATELRLALYPQLEQGEVARSGQEGQMSRPQAVAEAPVEVLDEPAPMAVMAPPPAPMERAQQEEDSSTLDSIQVTGSRIKGADLFSYPADALVQTGSARPDWTWHRHHIGWNGPLLPDDEFGLMVSPPWLTRLWRVLAVLLLGGLLWRLAQPLPSRRTAAPIAPVLSAVLLAGATLASMPVAWAQSTPEGVRLDELRARLLQRDEPCRPECGALGSAAIVAAGERLTLALQAQAQAEVVWPLPRPDASLALQAVRVDGGEASVLRNGEGAWIRLERGVHRVEVDYLGTGGRWRVAFPHPPATVELQAEGFEAVGLDRGRLVGDTLELIAPRVAAPADDGSAAATVEEAIPPFVHVSRHFHLDQFWEVGVTVKRVAPSRGGINLAVPLLPGEQPFADAPPVRDGRAIVSMPAGVDEVTWRSRLVPAPEYQLTAGDGRAYAEEWNFLVSPLLHLETEGIPQAGQEYEDAARRRFLPLPGETLTLQVTRPEATPSARFAIENVMLQVHPGQRARDVALGFELRATQPGQHRFPLPPNAELLRFQVDGEDQPRILEDGSLRLMLTPGVQHIRVDWREPLGVGARIASPELSLGGSSSNLRLTLQLPDDRWLLLTRGPRVGPAVLLWGELAVMLLAAFLLARFGGTPLRLHHWLLLGLGFSTLSWFAAAIVAAWLLALGWRARHPELVERRGFPWLQLALFGLGGIALLALLVAIPTGLLGRPDMHIVGNGSSATHLHWFADRSEDGTLPVVQAFSVPLWVYKLAILAWSIWLANALIGWLRWGWSALGSGGRWRPLWRRRAVGATTSAVEPTPSADAGDQPSDIDK